jgi:hypothetical protein
MHDHVDPAEVGGGASVAQQAQPAERPRINFEPEQPTVWQLLLQVLIGIGIASGLALLWAMEAIRNVYFRLLDRLNIRPRKNRRASAFPPGRTEPRARPEPGL